MIKKLKEALYFPIASYFRFFAQIQLSLWSPRIIVVTGSSGKTTLLHLIESQLQDQARYSHRANSSFGVPFDILGLNRQKLTLDEWLYLFLTAPLKAFKKPYAQKIYVVETDCDRPNEGAFLAGLLKPEVTIWLSCDRSHCAQFDSLVRQGKYPTVEDAIAQEYGHFLRSARSLAVVDDSSLIGSQLNGLKSPVKKIARKSLEDYRVFKDRTEFKISRGKYQFNHLLPRDTFYSISATKILMDYLNLEMDDFTKFYLPPGRSSVLKGIKNTTIIDSSYNSTGKALEIMLEMFRLYPAKTKWVVLGDILEQGDEEKEEHEKIADLIIDLKPEQVILVGPRLSKFTYPKLVSSAGDTKACHSELISESNEMLKPFVRQLTDQGGQVQHDVKYVTHASDLMKVEKFERPKDALTYLEENIKGGEVILFKGARFLEGIIEYLLLNKDDVSKLCRREKIWQIRRKKWGL